ncbi:MAG TPA: Maf family protein, partial [Candidatus Wallbacteria bacterium]|nr:Maf family protein [Candidatus Wallbacteria bacterium]
MKNIKSITDEKSKVKILLASKSPRRQELLKNINLDFEVAVSNFDEKSISAKDRQPGNYAGELALRKAETVADSIKAEKGMEYLVIGA